MTLTLLNFNNYYNRIVKRYNTLEEYSTYGTVLAQLTNVENFNPNDGIGTSQIINYDGLTAPDYLIVSDYQNNIISRWFILEAARTRGLQYKIDLYRDVIADWWNEVINADVFIEKAILPESSALIFNNENFSVNQIKTRESLLKDKSNSAWIVGYMSSKEHVDGNGAPANLVSSFSTENMIPDIIYENFSEFPLYKYSNINPNKERCFSNPKEIKYCIYSKNGNKIQKIAFDSTGAAYTGIKNNFGVATLVPDAIQNVSELNPTYQYPTNTNVNVLYNNNTLTSNNTDPSFCNYLSREFKKDGTFTFINGILSDSLNESLNILDYNGKIIKFNNDENIYKISVESLGSIQNEELLEAQSNVWTAFNASFLRARSYNPNAIGSTASAGSFGVNYFASEFAVILSKIERNLYNVIIQPKRNYSLDDSPYDMFCIPYSDTLDIYKNGVYKFTSNKNIALNAAMALSRDYTAANYLYDIQILPFCPIQSMIVDDNKIDFEGIEVSSIMRNVKPDNEEVALLYWCKSSSFTFNIPYNIAIRNKKISNQVDVWRICSPNYNGIFEFSAAKNDGVQFFNVDCTYKPFNPYIHVNPNFNNLYGSDFNDSRGLILQGDFSLPQITDQWKTYELNNKNYMNIFNRQIENMEFNNALDRQEARVNAITGTIGGLSQGAMAGGYVGGGVGAAIGGVVGGVTSAVGGYADMAILKERQNEALDFTKDNFGYQLGTIKALPYTIAKTSSLTLNNKLFPILEYYTCSPEELEAFINKIKYNGMTVMIIDKIKNYGNNNFEYSEYNYIKGKLIRSEEIADDFHVLNVISGELDKGVYV